MSNNKHNNQSPSPLTPDQQRIKNLEARLDTVETQLLSCLTFMRYHAEEAARKVAPLRAAPLKVIPKA